MHWAARNGHETVSRLLLERHARNLGTDVDAETIESVHKSASLSMCSFHLV
jgi:hypothetical protein